MKLLRVFNRRPHPAVRAVQLRRVGKCLLEELQQHTAYELGIHLIDSDEMAELNETFLGHTGSTDVITFNHQETPDGDLQGEIFISVPDALLHALQFKTTWQSEIVRYVVHGVLHLEGYDDLTPGPRRLMKREENKLLKALSQRFDLGKLGPA